MNEQIRNTHPPQTEIIAVSRRFVPGILAVVMFSVFVAFMIGYFLGVKYTTDEFVTQIRQETFADQLLAGSASATSGAAPENAAQTMDTAGEETSTENSVHATDVSAALSDGPQLSTAALQEAPKNIAASPMRYGAELIGFGTKGAAEDFIKRVAHYSPMPLELKERQSKTPRGKVIKWYQVVTKKYEQKQELQKMLDTLIKKEHLHDIKIVAYAPNTKDLA